MENILFGGLIVGMVLGAISILIGLFSEGVCRNLPYASEWHLTQDDSPIMFGISLGIAMGLMFIGFTWVFSIPIMLSGFGCYFGGKYVSKVIRQYQIVPKDK